MKIAVVLSVAILANSIGNVCLSKGMKQLEAGEAGAARLFDVGWHAITSPWVILGVLLLIVFLVSYLAALSETDLSFVLPATAPAYVLTAVFSRIFLNETITLLRWSGTLLIVLGTCLVARTFRSSARQGSEASSPAESQETWGPQRTAPERLVR